MKDEDTDIADMFFDDHGVPYETNTTSSSSVVLPVLHVLWGRPWNNFALAMLSTLNLDRGRGGKAYVRVIKSWHPIATDVSPQRVTVYLADDNRTIKRIEQECRVEMFSSRNGAEVAAKLDLGRWWVTT
jgi:hypothetical protein